MNKRCIPYGRYRVDLVERFAIIDHSDGADRAVLIVNKLRHGYRAVSTMRRSGIATPPPRHLSAAAATASAFSIEAT
jgi:hypothetical protein